ncbi:KDO2-lipid IV(A) lauroyltransferase [Tamaricihabitans halophyticus]|uniref:KDO2-lipid IV(A) lauroyltransferase n=1 Tax=Tamaricihabitans halophyticus TaxID=1262583 RepID=A0A4R2Q1Q1_9PSEU|nr:phosphatidylinositol mannoside acyltransferase [Tamaricihabitans halophyticus]TCP41654.1 KDO2-lipid IV(A) lauroyltransferase [Tamaricihabitans halophyticus]
MSGRLGERIQDHGYGLGWRLVRALPKGIASGAFQLGADLAAWRGGPRAAQLRRNLARVVPQAGPAELDELVRDGLRSYARYWREAFRLPAMDLGATFRQVHSVATGMEYVDAALEAGNGAVLALPHSGNWDISGVYLVGYSGQFTTVVERLEPESVYQRFVAYRESLGFEVIPHDGTGGSPTRLLLKRLRQNRLVCLLSDRDLSPSGMPVSFFGEQARMPAGPAKLAAYTGAALLPAHTWFTEDGWGLRIHPPIRVNAKEEVPAAMQTLADVFAADIATHPADWHMMQPLWDRDLPGDDRAAGPQR